MKTKKIITSVCTAAVFASLICMPAYAASGDVAGDLADCIPTDQNSCRSCCISSHRSDPCRVLFWKTGNGIL